MKLGFWPGLLVGVQRKSFSTAEAEQGSHRYELNLYHYLSIKSSSSARKFSVFAAAAEKLPSLL